MQPLLISSGDPSGIGIELIIQLWQKRFLNKVPSFFVLGDPDIFEKRQILCKQKDAIKNEKTFSLTLLSEEMLEKDDFPKQIDCLFQNSLPILPLKNRQVDQPKIPSLENAAGILESIERAVFYLHAGKASALITAPICKDILYQAGFSFPGHTEFLSFLTRTIYQKDNLPVMMLANQYLRTVPITIHIPLKEVFNHLTSKQIIQTGQVVNDDLKIKFNIKNPRLFFSGLNPHAGENGKLGQEENEIIIPALKSLKEQSILAEGPYPADSLFHKTMRNTYDAALCMYHDQALIPVKTLDFSNCVNITLGLPFIRTSPAHGTAFDIVGTNQASSQSFYAAIMSAQNLAKNQDRQPL